MMGKHLPAVQHGQRRLRATSAVAIGLMVFLAACGGGETVAPGGAAATTDDATDGEPTADGPCPDRNTEAIMEELAAMPYEERLAEIEARAKEEGNVILYSSSNLNLQELRMEDFMDLYPEIRYSYIRVSSSDLPDRVLQEANANRFMADVIDINALNGQAVWERGLVANHHGAPVPPEFPDRYVGDWYVTRTLTHFVIAYNTDMVSEEEAPQTWDDLLDPKWRGQVAIDTAPDAWVAGMINDRGYDGAREYIEALFDNDVLLRDGHTVQAQLLAAGEYAIASEVNAHRVAELAAGGAPVAFVVPDPTPANASSPSILKCANNPYAAALLMNYILSERGSQLIADTNLISLHPGVELLHPVLQGFIEPGHPYFERTMVLNPELAAELAGPAFELIGEVFAPRM